MIKFKSLLVKVFISLLILFVTGGIVLSVTYCSFVKMVRQTLIEVAQQVARVVEADLNAYLESLEVIAQFYLTIDDYSSDYKLGLLKKEVERKGFLRISVADLHGYAVTTDGQQLYVGDRTYYKTALLGTANVSEALDSRVDGKRIIVFAVPIRDGGRIAGVLYSTRDINFLSEITDDLRFGGVGNTFIIDQFGNTIAHDRRDFVERRDNYLNGPENVKFKELAVLEQQMISGVVGTAVYEYDGVKKYSGFAPIKGTNWSVAVSVAKTLLFANANQIIWILAFIILGLIGWVAYLVVRSVYLQKSLVIEKSFSEIAINTAGIMIIGLDVAGRIERLNPLAEEQIGLTAVEVRDKMVSSYLNLDLAELQKAYDQGRQLECSWVNHKTGESVFGLWSVHRETAKDETPLYYELIGLDITGRKKNEQIIQRLAYYDKLTGLPNRARLLKKLNDSFRQQGCLLSGVMVLFDIYNFRNINQVFGNSFGDKVLLEIAAVLRQIADDQYYVAKLNSDEFVLVSTKLRDISQTETIVKNILATFAGQLEVDGNRLKVDCNMGISTFELRTEPDENLFKKAQVAMAKAKEGGRDSYAYYDRSLENDLVQKMQMESSLREALEFKEFEVYYQPIFSLSNGCLTGFEALLRWRSPKYGWVSPANFIPLAEESQIILPLGQWVIETSCQFAEGLRRAGYGKLRVSVNISVIQLMASDFIESTKKILKRTRVSREAIAFEITESALMTSFDDNVGKLLELKELGLEIHLDDFGTGYSSLNYLKNLPIDVVKIDKSFVDNIVEDRLKLGLLTSIIELVNRLGMGVVAEGVETREQMKLLEQHNCHYVQGYLLSKPVSEIEVLEIITAKNSLLKCLASGT